MDLIQIVVLSIVQGITEFLPISSSAHLILISKSFGWQDQGILFDIYVHGGSLFAIIYAFRKEVSILIQRVFSPYKQNLLLCLIVATLPVALVGFLGGDFIEQNFRSLEFLILTTFLFAIFYTLQINTVEKRIQSNPLISKILLSLACFKYLLSCQGSQDRPSL